MAYQVNCGIGAVASVQTFVLDGLEANPGGAPADLWSVVHQQWYVPCARFLFALVVVMRRWA